MANQPLEDTQHPQALGKCRSQAQYNVAPTRTREERKEREEGMWRIEPSYMWVGV
jgi:hypothetical protein